ncbi:hypothetical protein STEG23_030614 [Scotinomys teguina]
MFQRVQVLAAEPDHWNSIPGTHMVKCENRLLLVMDETDPQKSNSDSLREPVTRHEWNLQLVFGIYNK